MKQNIYLILISLFYSTIVIGDSQEYSFPKQTDEIVDPYEKWNRKIFQANLFLDKSVLRPASAIYNTAVPKWGQDRVGDFTANLRQPLIVINYILQGNKEGAKKSFWRFFVNSTIGIGGLFNISSKATKELTAAEQDFGLTAAHHGVKPGPYLMLPFFGPSTVRDAGGLFVDFVINPTTYYFSNNFLLTENIVSLVNIRNENREFLEHIEKTSMDAYATVRSLYIQKRIGKPKGVKVTPNYEDYYYQELPNYEKLPSL